MNTKEQEKQNAIRRELIKVSLVDSIAILFIGFAVYTSFVADEGDFYPLLHNEWMLSGIFVVGAALMFWGWQKVFKVLKQNKQNQKN